MNLSNSLSNLLEKSLQPTRYDVKDLIDLKISNWHALVLLDNQDQMSEISKDEINAKDLSGHTPLEAAYRLNRTGLIEKLESLGALGDKEIIKDKGSGQPTKTMNTPIYLPFMGSTKRSRSAIWKERA